ncbi:MAG: ABC transporter permease [Blastochloris sp.]|nr:ABC transporter permease [Blastochloris sp.]
MTRLLLARAAQYLLVIWAAVTLNFLLPRLMPGSPLALLAGEEVGQLTAEERAQLLAEVGLDAPLPVQYVRYLGDLLRGELGYSYQRNQPVADVILQRLPWTLLLSGSSLVLATLIAVTLGALAAWNHGSRSDLGMVGFSLGLDSLPSFWIGMLLIAIFAVEWPIFPSFGAITAGRRYEGWAYVRDVGRHLFLPLVTLTLANLSATLLTTRSAMLAVLGAEYIVTARAKGLRERVVLFRHAFRNALPPIATLVGLNIAFAIGGATVVETVFSYPGIGRLTYDAVLARDYPMLQGAFLLTTLIVVAANLLVDMIYPWIDPRLRRGEA